MYDVIEYVDDVICLDVGEEMLGNDCFCFEFLGDKDEEFLFRIISDIVLFLNNRMVMFSRDFLKMFLVWKRIC